MKWTRGRKKTKNKKAEMLTWFVLADSRAGGLSMSKIARRYAMEGGGFEQPCRFLSMDVELCRRDGFRFADRNARNAKTKRFAYKISKPRQWIRLYARRKQVI